MTYAATDLGDCWGIDLSAKLSPTSIRNLAASMLPAPISQPISFVWRYVPLPGNDPRGDIDAEELAAWLDAKNALGNRIALLLVQHCRAGLWTPSAQQGQLDGQHAAEWAQKVGYLADCHIAMDDESVQAPQGVPVDVAMRAHAIAWCSAIRTGGVPVIYEGFSPGLTPDEEYALPNVDRYWGAFGPWNVSTRGVCCKQGIGIRLAGVDVDPDHAFPDKLGGALRGMIQVDDPPMPAAA